MNTNYNIKNFRVFDAEGAEARIAPFTVLTGCNSSGKSSIAKSILLLDNYLQKVKVASDKKNVLELGSYTMDFTDYPLNLLGRFDKVVNSSSASSEIEYRFTTDNNLEVVLVFVTNSADILNRGYLKSLIVLKEGTPVFSSERGTCILNTVPFLADYLEYLRKNLDPNDMPPDLFFEAYKYKNTYKFHKISYDSLKWAIENDSLFKVSILDKIGMLDKSNFLTKTDEMLTPAYNDIPGIKTYIHRLAEVFIESDSASFLEFFKQREKEWMSNLSPDHDYEEQPEAPLDWSHVNSYSTFSPTLTLKTFFG